MTLGSRLKDAFSMIVKSLRTIVSSSTIRDHGYLARDPNLSKDPARDPARDPSHHQLMRRRLTLPVQCSDTPSYQGEGEECPLAEQVAVSRQQRTRSLHLTHKQVMQSQLDFIISSSKYIY